MIICESYLTWVWFSHSVIFLLFCHCLNARQRYNEKWEPILLVLIFPCSGHEKSIFGFISGGNRTKNVFGVVIANFVAKSNAKNRLLGRKFAVRFLFPFWPLVISEWALVWCGLRILACSRQPCSHRFEWFPRSCDPTCAERYRHLFLHPLVANRMYVCYSGTRFS